MTPAAAAAADRVERTTRLLLAACREAGIVLTGDHRVSEVDAARLLGLSQSRLKALRHEGGGPPPYRVGVGGSRMSYRLDALSIWIEQRREG